MRNLPEYPADEIGKAGAGFRSITDTADTGRRMAG